MKRYRRAVVLALDNLRAHQYDAGGVDTFPNPAGAVGAVRFRYDRSVIRIDGVILSAMAFEEASILAGQGKLPKVHKAVIRLAVSHLEEPVIETIHPGHD